MTTEMKPQGYYTDKIFTPADMDKAIEKEREACAKVCEESNDMGSGYGLAQAIRARGQQ